MAAGTNQKKVSKWYVECLHFPRITAGYNANLFTVPMMRTKVLLPVFERDPGSKVSEWSDICFSDEREIPEYIHANQHLFNLRNSLPWYRVMCKCHKPKFQLWTLEKVKYAIVVSKYLMTTRVSRLTNDLHIHQCLNDSSNNLYPTGSFAQSQHQPL